MSSAAAGKNRKGDSAVASTSTGARASEVRDLAGLHRRWSEEARAALSERSKASGFGRGEPLSIPAQIATNGARTSAEPVDGTLRLPSDARVSDAYVPVSSPLKAKRQHWDEQLEAARERLRNIRATRSAALKLDQRQGGGTSSRDWDT